MSGELAKREMETGEKPTTSHGKASSEKSRNKGKRKEKKKDSSKGRRRNLLHTKRRRKNPLPTSRNGVGTRKRG
jgi:hypothetical protein